MFCEQHGLSQGKKNLEEKGNTHELLNEYLFPPHVSVRKIQTADITLTWVIWNLWEHICVACLSHYWITFMKASREKLNPNCILEKKMLQVAVLIYLMPVYQLITGHTLDLLCFQEHKDLSSRSSVIIWGNTTPPSVLHCRPLLCKTKQNNE